MMPAKEENERAETIGELTLERIVLRLMAMLFRVIRENGNKQI